MRFVRKVQPDIFVLNGDFLDMHGLSKFIKNPEAPSLKQEIKEATDLILWMDSRLPTNCKFYYQEGNHELRLVSATRNFLPSLAPMVTVMELLAIGSKDIKDIEIEWRDMSNPLMIDNFIIKHGSRISIKSGYTANRELDAEGRSVIMNHSHRVAFVARSYRDRTLYCVEGGHLSDETHPEYILKQGKVCDWQPGFSVLEEWNGVLIPRVKLFANDSTIV